MATIDVGVKLNLVDSSLREIASDIRRTVQSISPDLDIKLNTASIKRFLSEGRQRLPALEIKAKLSREAERALNNSLKRVVENQQIKKLGFAPGALRRLEKELEAALQPAVAARAERKQATGALRTAGAKETDDPSKLTGEQITILGQINKASRKVAVTEQAVAAIIEKIIEVKQAQLKLETDRVKSLQAGARALERRVREELSASDLPSSIKEEANVRKEAARKAKNSRDEGERRFREAERELERSVKEEAAEHQKKALLVKARREEEFRTAEAELKSALREEAEAHRKKAAAVKSRRDEEFREAERELKQAIRDEAEAHRKKAAATKARRDDEFKEAENELKAAIRQEAEEHKRKAAATRARRDEEFKEAERELKQAIRDETEAHKAKAAAVKSRRDEDFREAENALKAAVREEAREREEFRKVLKSRLRTEKELEALAKKILAQSILPSESERAAPTIEAPASAQRAGEEAVNATFLILEKQKLEAEARDRSLKAAERKASFDEKISKAAQEEAAAREKEREVRRAGLLTAEQAAAQEVQQIRANAAAAVLENAGTLQLVGIIRDTVSERARKLKALRAQPDVVAREAATRQKQQPSTGPSEEEVQRQVLQELAKKVAAERLNTIESNDELKRRGIVNAELRRLVIAVQKKRAEAEKSKEEESNKLIEQKNAELKREIAALRNSNNFARQGADLNRDLNDVLRERVAQAQRGGGLPGGEPVDLGQEIRGGAKSLNDELIRSGRIIKTGAERVANALESRKLKARLQAAAQTLGDVQRESRALTRAIARQATNVIRVESSGNEAAMKAVQDRLNRLLLQRAGVEERRTRAANDVLFLEQQLINAKKEEVRTTRGRTRRVGGTGAGGGGNTVTFRGAEDIQAFGKTLNPQQLAQFVATLKGAAQQGRSAGAAFKTFGRNVASSSKFVSDIEGRITSGTRAAFEFGRQVNFAAQRLAAWATPAAFLFRAIGLIQEAVQEIVRLDTQASRLEFFRPEGSILNNFIDGGATLADVFQKGAQDTRLFLSEATRLGANVGDVAEAFLISARVGEDFVRTTRDAAGVSRELSSSLSETVIGLVRLEAGALKAEDAVRKIVAIQRQFLTQLGDLDQAFRQQQFGNIGAQLARVAGETSFNVAELADTTSRVGAAFSQVEGTNIPNVLRLIADSAKATGASASRLGTTFRQLLTLAQQNEVALQEFGVSIRSADSGQVSFQGIISALQKVDELSKTAPAAAQALSKLLADRRNISDFKAIANIVGQLSTRFDELGSAQAQLDFVGDSVEKQFVQQQLQARTLESRLNSLSSTFTGFIATLGASDAFTSLTDTAQDFVELLTSVAEGLTNIGPLVSGLLATAATIAVPQVIAVAQGALAGLVATLSGGAARQALTAGILETKTAVESVNQAQREGFLTIEQSTAINAELLAITQEIALAERAVENAKNRILILEEQGVITAVEKNVLLAEQLVLEKQLERAQGREIAVQERAVKGLSTKNKNLSRAALPALAFAAVAAGSFFGDRIADGLAGQNKSLGAALGSAITGGIAGGVIGAQVGSAIAPGIGTAIGAGLGATLGGVGSFIGEIHDQQEAADKEQAIRDEARKRRLLAIASEEKRINLETQRQALLLKGNSDFQKSIAAKTQEVRLLQVKLQGLDAASEESKRIQLQILTEQQKIEVLKTNDVKEQLAIEARKIGFARQLVTIRQEEQTEIARLGVAQEALIQGLSRTQAAEIEIRFSETRIQRQLQSIREQIQAELQEASSIDITRDRQAAEESARRISDLRQRATLLQIQLEKENITQRRQVVDAASQEAQKQIEAWKSAAKEVTEAFENVVDLQSGLSNILTSQGELAADVISQRADELTGTLEARGSSLEARLTVLRRETSRQLAEIERSGELARGALRGGNIEAFSSADQINSAVSDLVSNIREAAERATGEEFNSDTQTFDIELSLLRERERVETQLFQQRIQQTSNELGLRRTLVSREIELFRTRLRAEQELIQLRSEQQKKFGEIVLEGPEKIKQVTDSIAAAEGFFSGIADLDAGGLRTLFQRARGAIARGQTEALKQVVQGLENRISLGGPEIVATIDNERLRDVLVRSLDPRVTARTLERQLKKEEEVLRQQTTEQQAIADRQRELFEITKQEERVQRAQLRVALVQESIAQRQRDRLITSAQQGVGAQLAQVALLNTLIQRGLRVSGIDGQPSSEQAAQGQDRAIGLSAEALRELGGGQDSTQELDANQANRNSRLVGALGGLSTELGTPLSELVSKFDNLGKDVNSETQGSFGSLTDAINRLPAELQKSISATLLTGISPVGVAAGTARATDAELNQAAEQRERRQEASKREAGETKRLEVLNRIAEITLEEKNRIDELRKNLQVGGTEANFRAQIAELDEKQAKALKKIDDRIEKTGIIFAPLSNLDPTATGTTDQRIDNADEERKRLIRLRRETLETINTQRTDLLRALGEIKDEQTGPQEVIITSDRSVLKNNNVNNARTGEAFTGRAGGTAGQLSDEIKRGQVALQKLTDELLRSIPATARLTSEVARAGPGLAGFADEVDNVSRKLGVLAQGVRPGTPGAPGARGDTGVGFARADTGLRTFLNTLQDRISFTGRGQGLAVQGEDTRRLINELRLQGEGGVAPTRIQAAELSRLQRRDARATGRGGGSTASVVNQLFEDANVSDELSEGFKQLFRQTVSVAGPGGTRVDTGRTFAEELEQITGATRTSRGLRVGQKSQETLSVDAVKNLFGDFGLGAFAENIQTRGQAAEMVNLLFKLNENLGKNSKKAQEETEKILQKILEAEIQRRRTEAADRRRARGEGLPGEVFAEGAPSARFDRGRRQDLADREAARKFITETNKLTEEQVKKITTATTDAAAIIEGAFKRSTDRLESIDIKTLNDVNFTIKFDTAGTTTAKDFARLFREELENSGVALPEATIELIVKSIRQNSAALSERGLIGVPIIENVDD